MTGVVAIVVDDPETAEVIRWIQKKRWDRKQSRACRQCRQQRWREGLRQCRNCRPLLTRHSHLR